MFVQLVPQVTAPVGQVHAEDTQLASEGHAVAQEPQWSGSLLVSTQDEPHSVPLHAHFELTQVPPVPQDVPHAPQLSTSLVRSTHLVPQGESPEGHAHLLAMQLAPEGQALPHAPQLAASVVRSTQPPGHEVLPVPQAQTPSAHVAAPQVVPHLPQFFGSPLRLVHTPGHASGKPTGHTHDPPTHEAPEGHFVVHVPHALTSVDRSLQVFPQLTVGSGQAHLPATQAVVDGHALAHEPQFALSVARSMQAAPQRVWPSEQATSEGASVLASALESAAASNTL